MLIAKPVVQRVFLIAGGSNADGQALVTDMPGQLGGTMDGVRIYAKPDNGPADNGAWQVLSAGRHGNNSDPDGIAIDPRFGPEMQFGWRLREQFGGNVAIVKRAAPDSLLVRTASARSWHPDDDGTYLNEMIDNRLRPALTRINGNVQISAFVWIQGEGDASLGASLAGGYEAALRALVSGIRTRLARPILPIAIARIVGGRSAAGTRIVRAAQAAVAADTPGIMLVKCDGFSMAADGVSFDAVGQVSLGNALADACISYAL